MAATELTNRAIGRYFHLCWEVWVIVANCAALVVSSTLLIKTRRARQTHLTVFSMTIGDLTTGIVTLAFHIVSGGDFGTLTKAQCQVNATFLVFLSMQSMLLVLMLGVVRYRVLVQKPLSMKVVQMLLVALFITCPAYALFCALTPGLVAPSVSRYYCFHRYGRFDAVTTFVTVIAGLFGTAPALSLLVCYVRLFHKMKAFEQEAGNGMTKYSQRVAHVGFTVVLTYCLSIIPYNIQILYRLFAAPESEVPADVDAVVSIVIHLNFGINPILYFVFKRDCRQLVRKWFGRAFGISTLSTRSTLDSKRRASCLSNATMSKAAAASIASLHAETTLIESQAADIECAADVSSKRRMSRLSTATLKRARTAAAALRSNTAASITIAAAQQPDIDCADVASKRRILRLKTGTRAEAQAAAAASGLNTETTVTVEAQKRLNIECADYLSRSRISRLRTENTMGFSPDLESTPIEPQVMTEPSSFRLSRSPTREELARSLPLREA